MLIYKVNSSSKQKFISTKALNTLGVKLAGSKLGVSFKKRSKSDVTHANKYINSHCADYQLSKHVRALKIAHHCPVV